MIISARSKEFFKAIKTISFSFSGTTKSYEVIDTKNSHLIYIKDPQATLPYLSQIKTSSGKQGIVIKLQDRNITVIGLYQNIQPTDKIQITNISQNKIDPKFTPKFNNVYDINQQSIGDVQDVTTNNNLKCQILKQGKRSRIQTISPLLTLGYDIFVGDFVTFSGPLGSGRTNNAINTLECFTNSNIKEPIGIYFNSNPNDFINASIRAASKYRTISFARIPTKFNPKINVNQPNIGNLSSVGIYMLAAKCIQIANKLKNEGNNVMLVIDNLQEVLANQWTILQNLKLPIAPFSILNELYSSSSQGSLGKSGGKNTKQGSLTTIAITNPQDQDVLQQYTTFGNNSKYLRTLCQQIQHPLQLTLNSNQITSSVVKNQMRMKINMLLREKKQKQMLTKLKLIRNQPWQHYYILDSQWWVQALKTYIPVSISDQNLLLWFINTNVEQDYVAHWRIRCIEAYNQYLDFLARPDDLHIGMDKQQLQNFIELCKQQKTFDIFKKDYLN